MYLGNGVGAMPWQGPSGKHAERVSQIASTVAPPSPASVLCPTSYVAQLALAPDSPLRPETYASHWQGSILTLSHHQNGPGERKEKSKWTTGGQTGKIVNEGTNKNNKHSQCGKKFLINKS